MTLRLRLALWYGALLAAILAAGFTIAYLIHATFPHEAGDPVFDASLERLRLVLVGVGIGGAAAALLGGWTIASGALRPIRRMIETARAIALSRGFSRRIEVRAEARDELAELARTFNEMLASLDDAFHRQQRFVADVSHELRTPLTVLQGDLELLSSGRLTPDEAAATLAEVREETRRLARLVDDLLVLARADAGPQPLRAAPVDLDEVVMEVFRDLRGQAGPRLRVTDLDVAVVRGERDRLKQLVLILTDNALRYTPAPGEVRLSLRRKGGEAVIVVDDDGIGIGPETARRAFERFYRGEDARRADPAGTGLGLAIARWIVERHGGAISLEPRQDRGTRASVRLPAARDGRSADAAGA
ncbi:MAG TPA: HAMP domain-containing sensor histidine kinase [Candidatus Limnocylindria bacterium]|nr:HAMP domain-containing sensor histidine kinase [Candidatus Limnocylindria bacterium]